MEDLKDIYGRIEAAKAEIDALAPLVKEASDRMFRGHVQPNGRPKTFDVGFVVTEDAPVMVRTRAGTIVNELRACLDGLASTLAVRNGKSTAGVYFPISQSHEAFAEDGVGKIKKLSVEDQAKIAALHPYREKNPILYGLHQADVMRKHVRLGGVGGVNSQSSIGGLYRSTGGGRGVFMQSHYNGIYIERMEHLGGQIAAAVGEPVLVATGVPAELELSLYVEVCYIEPADLAGKPLIPTLTGFATTVSGIVKQFDGA